MARHTDQLWKCGTIFLVSFMFLVNNVDPEFSHLLQLLHSLSMNATVGDVWWNLLFQLPLCPGLLEVL